VTGLLNYAGEKALAKSVKSKIIAVLVLASVALFSCSNDLSSNDLTLPPVQEETEPTPPEIIPPDTSDTTPIPTIPDIDPELIDPIEEQIAEIIASMTLYEKVCQMLIVALDTITGTPGKTIVDDAAIAALELYPVGGVIHFSPNIESREQITLLNSSLQEISKLPLFIAVDEEGGGVARLKQKLNAHSVQDMLTYENDGEEKAFENAVIISQALAEHGFNTNFAPVADVWSNPANSVIGKRAFSTDFELAADLVASAVRGYNESNIICSLKHFPGHGNTYEDTHQGTAYINKTFDELRDGEFLPFITGIAAGADMVMTGHLIVPDIDELPATLSAILITDILRNELGYSGVVITDALAMNAISRHFDTAFVAITAINAGVDILLLPVNIDETISAITEAVLNGDIHESRIDESIRRILLLKLGLVHNPA